MEMNENTVKPLLSGHSIKRTPSNGHQLTSYISLYNEPLFSEHPTELIVVLDYVLEIRIVVD